MEADLLRSLASPLLDPAHALLVRASVPEPLRGALVTLVDASGLLAIAAALAALGRLGRPEVGAAARRAVAGASGVVAALLGLWVLQHPSERFDELFGRWDHLAFAGAAGFAITVLTGAWRAWWLTVVSGGILLVQAGPVAVGMAVGLTATGMLLLRTPLRAHLAATAVAQAALIAAVYGVAFWLRTWDLLGAARVQGLLAFWVLRHVSLVVSAVRTTPPSPADCGAFVAFYPGAMGLLGAPEVHAEFARRNLTRPPVLQHHKAARRVVEGVLLRAASTLMPITVERVAASATPVEAWAFAVAYFVKIALSVMGWWRAVDATALFFGVQLRANFAGLLSCRNPTELWWSWRGTLTNWLVQHVYAPLGASRRHQTLNIAAAFTVSFLWHALGVPFLTPAFGLEHVAAVALWAAVNGMAVIAHANANRAGVLRAPAAVPGWLRVATATLLTWALGSLTPILLLYQGPAVENLPRLLGVLLGLG